MSNVTFRVRVYSWFVQANGNAGRGRMIPTNIVAHNYEHALAIEDMFRSAASAEPECITYETDVQVRIGGQWFDGPRVNELLEDANEAIGIVAAYRNKRSRELRD
jgi:hypothetical protein